MALIDSKELSKYAWSNPDVTVDGEGYISLYTVENFAEEHAIDAAPVVHGRWVVRGGRYRCSVCDAKALWKDTGGTGGWSHEYEQAITSVCPNCGARMDGGGGT